MLFTQLPRGNSERLQSVGRTRGDIDFRLCQLKEATDSLSSRNGHVLSVIGGCGRGSARGGCVSAGAAWRGCHGSFETSIRKKLVITSKVKSFLSGNPFYL